MASLTSQERLRILCQSTTEHINLENLQAKLTANPTKPLIGYWGVSPTGRIPISYFLGSFIVADAVAAGCQVKILLADIHSFLDSRKAPKGDTRRSKYYQTIIEEVLKLLSVDMSKVEFVLGSSFQSSTEYFLDLLDLAASVKVNHALDAGTQVLKDTKDPNVSDLLYSLMQVLDEKSLQADFEIGGLDQRKIFKLGLNVHKKLNLNTCYLMNPMAPALSTKSNKTETKDETKDEDKPQSKMSSSDVNGKIDMLDDKVKIKRVLKKTYCLQNDIQDNSILMLCKLIICPLLKRLSKKLIVKQRDQPDTEVKNYLELETLFAAGLHPGDLKDTVTEWLHEALEPIRNRFLDPELVTLMKEVYG